MYDCLIIGGGPAGLSAAIYMGRFMRSTLVLDSGAGRSSFAQVNENYLGFPGGVKVQELRELGRQQAERFGVEFRECEVTALRSDGANFMAETSEGAFTGRTVILSTGVCDIWPDLPDVLDYVGKSLFWCITCDGFRALDKRVLIFGCSDEAAVTTCQFHLYTRQLTFLSAPGTLTCSDDSLCSLRENKVKMVDGTVKEILGTPDDFRGVVLDSGERIEADLMFSLLGVTVNNRLALDLGVRCTPSGYVLVDEEGYTNVPGVFAAGDLSKAHTHQVVSAAHEGAEAAQTANYYLYADYQKHE